MAEYNSISLPFAIPTQLIVGRTYALLPVPSSFKSLAAVTFSTTYNGTYTDLANATTGAPINNAGFIKVAAPTSVTITRNPFKK
jgi:hypothetical protein